MCGIRKEIGLGTTIWDKVGVAVVVDMMRNARLQ